MVAIICYTASNFSTKSYNRKRFTIISSTLKRNVREFFSFFFSLETKNNRILNFRTQRRTNMCLNLDSTESCDNLKTFCRVELFGSHIILQLYKLHGLSFLFL